MYPMMGAGTQKIEINKPKKGSANAQMPSEEYKAMMASMLKQQELEVGTGQLLENNRSPQYGNVNFPGLAQGLNQGRMSMGMTNDSPGNAPLSKPTAQTAQLGFFSATNNPQKQPEIMGTEAEEGIRQRVMGEPGGLNDRASLYNIQRA